MGLVAVGGTLSAVGGSLPGAPVVTPTPTVQSLQLARLSGAITTAPVVTPPETTTNVWDGDPTLGLPSFPTVNYTSLYQSGDSVSQALARLNTYAVVLLPNGFDEEFSDFAFASNFGIFNRYLMGIGGSSPTQARIRLKPLSSTKASSVPPQGDPSVLTTNSLYLARFGQVGEGTSSATPEAYRHTYLYGFTLEGTDQQINVNSGNRPHNYGGVMNYLSNGSIWQNMKFVAPSYGHWGWQPGETFGINDYKGNGNIYRRIEVDGRNAAGVLRGASPLGGNASQNITLEDCYFHDSYVSGLTWSFTGDVSSTGSATNGVTTRRVKVERNGNHSFTTGQTFTGFNHENVLGAVRHYNPNISTLDTRSWAANHMVFNNVLIDNTNIRVEEPVVSGGWPAYKGAFTVSFPGGLGGMTNKQATAPVVIRNGVTLAPYHVYSNPGTTPLANLNPATQYVIVHGST